MYTVARPTDRCIESYSSMYQGRKQPKLLHFILSE